MPISMPLYIQAAQNGVPQANLNMNNMNAANAAAIAAAVNSANMSNTSNNANPTKENDVEYAALGLLSLLAAQTDGAESSTSPKITQANFMQMIKEPAYGDRKDLHPWVKSIEELFTNKYTVELPTGIKTALHNFYSIRILPVTKIEILKDIVESVCLKKKSLQKMAMEFKSPESTENYLDTMEDKQFLHSRSLILALGINHAVMLLSQEHPSIIYHEYMQVETYENEFKDALTLGKVFDLSYTIKCLGMMKILTHQLRLECSQRMKSIVCEAILMVTSEFNSQTNLTTKTKIIENIFNQITLRKAAEALTGSSIVALKDELANGEVISSPKQGEVDPYLLSGVENKVPFKTTMVNSACIDTEAAVNLNTDISSTPQSRSIALTLAAAESHLPLKRDFSNISAATTSSANSVSSHPMVPPGAVTNLQDIIITQDRFEDHFLKSENADQLDSNLLSWLLQIYNQQIASKEYIWELKEVYDRISQKKSTLIKELHRITGIEESELKERVGYKQCLQSRCLLLALVVNRALELLYDQNLLKFQQYYDHVACKQEFGELWANTKFADLEFATKCMVVMKMIKRELELDCHEGMKGIVCTAAVMIAYPSLKYVPGKKQSVKFQILERMFELITECKPKPRQNNHHSRRSLNPNADYNGAENDGEGDEEGAEKRAITEEVASLEE